LSEVKQNGKSRQQHNNKAQGSKLPNQTAPLPMLTTTKQTDTSNNDITNFRQSAVLGVVMAVVAVEIELSLLLPMQGASTAAFLSRIR
jgi:hypothetical protein